MTCLCEAYPVKRIPFHERDSREWREKRDWPGSLSSGVSSVAQAVRFSPLFYERRDTRYEMRDRGQVPY